MREMAYWNEIGEWFIVSKKTDKSGSIEIYVPTKMEIDGQTYNLFERQELEEGDYKLYTTTTEGDEVGEER